MRFRSLISKNVVEERMKLNFSFSVRGPDRVSEELATVLSKKGSWEFKSLFDIVHANLRSKDLARGGEEMLRLRTHEKLQNFLFSGIVKKNGKEYSGVPKALAAFFKTAAEFNERFASGNHCRPPLKPEVSETPKAKTATKGEKVGKTKLSVRKAPERLGQEGKKRGKAPAQGRAPRQSGNGSR